MTDQELRRIEFRTEVRWVPEYIADMLAGIETERLTYEEAMKQANQKLLGNFIKSSVDAATKPSPF